MAESICHVAWVENDGPRLLPTLYGLLAGQLYLHGSPRSGILKAAKNQRQPCICVSLSDGLVLARSALHHSMNYRSVVLFGQPREVVDEAEKRRALDALMQQVLPQRGGETRAPDEAELRATAVVAISIADASAKVRRGPPKDAGRDLSLPHWAGVLPLIRDYGRPKPAPDLTLPTPLPASVERLLKEPYIEEQRAGLRLSNDREALDIKAITRFLSEESYWAQGVSEEVVRKSIAGSLCIGVYREEQQLGFCRLVTDYATFGYLCDAFVVASERGRGIGSWMLEALQAAPRLADLRRWLLGTRDAHPFYAAKGWRPLQQPQVFMERRARATSPSATSAHSTRPE